MWTTEFLRQVRELEAGWAMTCFPATGRVLEIGAGAGWQSRYFAGHGYEVQAVDIQDPRYAWERVYPILAYDGLHLPFPDGHFDVVYSSSVLEHVQDLDGLCREMSRVLSKEGTLVHVLPTASWRWWSNLTQVSEVWPQARGELARPGLSGARRLRAVLAAVWYNAFPQRHGEKGNAWTEVYWFSRFRWRRDFRRAGFRVLRVIPNRLFYTGASLLGARLNPSLRRRLSCVLGSPSMLYVLGRDRA
jgi:SAM-dependent methyltransferase